MEHTLRYGTQELTLELPEGVTVDVFEPKRAPCLADPVAELQAALDAPIGCMPLEGRSAPKSVAIALPDETRPFPTKLLLPPLLKRLFNAFPTLNGEDVAIVVGGGLHPPADEAQLARILPENLHGCRVVSHDAKHSPMRSFGTTSRGTPVEVNKVYGDAELKIVMGMVDAHQFVGFTGGAKGVVIGCASEAMIEANHRMMREETACAGNIENNPVRLDLNESGEMIGVDIAINVVLDPHKKPVALMAGVPALVMRAAAQQTGFLYGLELTEPYDIVVASCGGAPKDICLYQAQKGLNSATQCAKPGAKIILVAQCAQGIGDEVYEEYVKQYPCAYSLKKAFEASPFKMGAHKAYLFARATTNFDVKIHSDLSREALAQCLLEKGDLQSTVDGWLAENNGPVRIALLKNANSSFFTQQ